MDLNGTISLFFTFHLRVFELSHKSDKEPRSLTGVLVCASYLLIIYKFKSNKDDIRKYLGYKIAELHYECPGESIGDEDEERSVHFLIRRSTTGHHRRTSVFHMLKEVLGSD